MIRKIGLLLGIVFLGLTTALAGADRPAKSIRLSFPEKKWTLQISPPDFEITENEISAKGMGRRIMGTYKIEQNTEVNMSVFLETAPEKGDSKACRNYYMGRLKKAPFFPDAKDVKTSEKGSIAFFEYTIKEIGGQPINQKNLYAYISNDGVWIDIHLSKILWEEKDQKAFDAITKTIKIAKLDDSKTVKYAEDFTIQLNAGLKKFFDQNQPDEAKEVLSVLAKTTKNVSTPFFWLGNIFYSQKNYPDAIKSYQTAFDMEKTSRFLLDEAVRMGIDNLGMAYGISGNLKKAEETFLSGIKDYPFYPHFYYNLACTYAEGKENDKALKCLETAFQKAESYTAEKLPNASTDSSFKILKETPAFEELLKKYNRE